MTTKLMREHLRDLEQLRDKIAGVAHDYEDDINPFTGIIRPGEQEEKDKVAAYEAKVMTLKKEYLELRKTGKASA